MQSSQTPPGEERQAECADDLAGPSGLGEGARAGELPEWARRAFGKHWELVEPWRQRIDTNFTLDQYRTIVYGTLDQRVRMTLICIKVFGYSMLFFFTVGWIFDPSLETIHPIGLIAALAITAVVMALRMDWSLPAVEITVVKRGFRKKKHDVGDSVPNAHKDTAS